MSWLTLHKPRKLEKTDFVIYQFWLYSVRLLILCPNSPKVHKCPGHHCESEGTKELHNLKFSFCFFLPLSSKRARVSSVRSEETFLKSSCCSAYQWLRSPWVTGPTVPHIHFCIFRNSNYFLIGASLFGYPGNPEEMCRFKGPVGKSVFCPPDGRRRKRWTG